MSIWYGIYEIVEVRMVHEFGRIVAEFDDKAQELGLHIFSPASLSYDCDGDRSQLSSGSPAFALTED